MQHKVLVYHKVDNKAEAGLTRIPVDTYIQQIRSLNFGKWNLQSLSNLETYAKGERVCGLTFDDGYAKLLDHAIAPLKIHGFTATVFIPTDWIGHENLWDWASFGQRYRHMDKDDMLRWISAGNEIASHGASHKQLSLIPERQWSREIIDSKHILEDHTGEEIRWFAPPFGYINRKIVKMGIKCGYSGFAMIRTPKWAAEYDEIKFVNRTPVYLGDSLRNLRLKMEDEHILHNMEMLKVEIIHRTNILTVLAQKLFGKFFPVW